MLLNLRLLDGRGETILEETMVGKAREVVVERIPLVRRDLLLQQDKQHPNGDKKLLQIPDLVGDGVVSRMIRHPGVEEEHQRPDDESSDNGDFAQALAR